MNPGVDNRGQPRLMVNFAECRQPDASRRALAQGVAQPPLKTKRKALGSIFARDVVQCPTCSGWRPEIAVVLTKDGWSCDGCISAARRAGTFEEWQPGDVLQVDLTKAIHKSLAL